MRRTWSKIVGVGVSFAILGAACGGEANTAPAEAPSATHDMGSGGEATTDTAAADLRTNLNLLLQEHVYLASIATGEALGGRTELFEAAAGALDANSDEIIATFGSVYPDAEGTFKDGWKGHIGFVVDYTTALASDDAAGQEAAVADLQGYSESFGQFLSDTVEGLPEGEAVSSLIMEHVITLKSVIDAQKAGTVTDAFTALREAAGHMHMLGDPLAGAIVADNPEAFE